jgi:hypothetical protein
MFSAGLPDSLLLVLAASALIAGARRTAGVLTDEPLSLVISTIVLFAATAVAEALLLGLVGLSGNAVALSGLAMLSGLGVCVALPPAGGELVAAARSAVSRAGPTARITGAGALGALIGVIATQLRRPILGEDAIIYHLPEVIGFVQSGHAGRVLPEIYGLPVGNYPLTQEVLLSWFTGISHGYSAMLLVTLAGAPLLALAGWLGLQELDVRPRVQTLVLSAVLLSPMVVQAWVRPGTDLPATDWLACCWALCLAARRQPALLAVAIVAAGLALGTKTTVATWSIVVLLYALWGARADLASHRRALLMSLAIAILCGLLWYLRNWLEHGSPLWPFASLPGGQALPPVLAHLSTSLLERPRATLLEHLDLYGTTLAGAVVLLLGGALCILPGLRLSARALTIAAAAVVLGIVEYAAGPVTGLPRGGGFLFGELFPSTLRYLMPVLAASGVAFGLAASSDSRPVRMAVLFALAGALVWNLRSDVSAGFGIAYDGWLWTGLVLGGLTAALGCRLAGSSASSTAASPSTPKAARSMFGPSGSARPAPAWSGCALTAGTGILSALILAAGSHSFSQRLAGTDNYADAVTRFMVQQPTFLSGQTGIATSFTGLGQLAGNSLQHPLTLVPVHISCGQVAELHVRDYLIIATYEQEAPPSLQRLLPFGNVLSCLRADRWTPIFRNQRYAIYAPPALRAVSGHLAAPR